MLSRALLLVPAAVLLLAGCGRDEPVLRTVDHVDLARYQGDWFVIANIPYWLENGKVATFDRYRERPDGTFDNEFHFRRGSFDAPEVVWHGSAKVTDTVSNAVWSVGFLWPFSTDYLVIDLDPEYRWAVVGHPSRTYLWVLSRTRTLPEDVYQGILWRAAGQGYDASLVMKVPQPADG